MDKKKAILQFVDRYIQVRGYAPTVREIGAEVGIESTGHIHYHLMLLRKGGYLIALPIAQRSIRLSEAGKRYLQEVAS